MSANYASSSMLLTEPYSNFWMFDRAACCGSGFEFDLVAPADFASMTESAHPPYSLPLPTRRDLEARLQRTVVYLYIR